jgi:hypothetical protein
MNRTTFVATIAALVLVLSVERYADASVAVVELTPTVLADPKVSSVIRVSISAEPDASGAYEVVVSGPVAPRLKVWGYLQIGSEDKLRLVTGVAMDHDGRHAKERDGQKGWSCSFRIDRALAADAILRVTRDFGPTATRYDIPLKTFMPAQK